MNLRYDMHTADDVLGFAPHPQRQMRLLGIGYKWAEPMSIGDQWWFFDCINVPNPLPRYLSELGDDVAPSA